MRAPNTLPRSGGPSPGQSQGQAGDRTLGHRTCEPVISEPSPPQAQVCNSGRVTPWGTGLAPPGLVGVAKVQLQVCPGIPGTEAAPGQHSDRPSEEHLGRRGAAPKRSVELLVPSSLKCIWGGRAPGHPRPVRGGHVPSEASSRSPAERAMEAAGAPRCAARPRLPHTGPRRPLYLWCRHGPQWPPCAGHQLSPPTCIMPASRVLTCLTQAGRRDSSGVRSCPSPSGPGSGEEPPRPRCLPPH